MDRTVSDLWLPLWVAVASVIFWPVDGQAEAGDGLRAGDLVLHPSVTASGSYNQNVFRLNPEESDPIGSPVVGIAPGLSISTINPTAVSVDMNSEVRWQQYLADDGRVRSQSGLDGHGGLGITLNPEGGLSLTLSDDLIYTNEPPPYPSREPYNRLVNRAGGKIGIHPGDKILNIGLGYKYSIYRYFTRRLGDLTKDSHDFDLDVSWRFLPKTAFLFSASTKLIKYEEPFNEAGGSTGLPNVESTPLNLQAGLSGLLTKRLAARAMAGYALGFYESGPSYNGLIGQAGLTYDYGSLDLDNELSLNYKRSFRDSSVGNFFGLHRVAFGWRQNFADKRFGVSAGAKWTYREYASLDEQIEDVGGVNVVEDSQGRTIAIPELYDNYISASAGLHSEFLKWWKASLKYTYSQNFTTNVVEIPSEQLEQLRAFNRHMVTLSTTIRY